MFGAFRLIKCEKCGAGTYDIASHVCGDSVTVAVDVATFRLEFEGCIWRPLQEWLTTNQGQFALYYSQRTH